MYYGAVFVTENTAILIKNGNWNARTILTYTLVSLWALRLFIYIFSRHNGEDYRYKPLRKVLQSHGLFIYILASLFGMYLFQVVVTFFNNASAIYICIYSKDDSSLIYLDYIGTIIWLVGFVCETVADL